MHYAIDYLKNPDVYDLGKSLTIIGAGNVAVDTARTALRNGVRDVYIMYRGGFEDITADNHEIEYAKIDGVKFELYKSPKEITDDGVIYVKTEPKVLENGETRFNPIWGTEKLFSSDSVIISVSQGPRDIIVTSTTGIEIDNKGLVSTDVSGRITRKGVFASGDVVTGAKTVVAAVKLSKEVVRAIDEYVNDTCRNQDN